jgi:hypothetical protein
MGKRIHDDVMDTALDDIADNGDILHICSAEPANYAGIAAISLGSTAITTGDGGGDYTIANGDTSGRKLTLGVQTITPSGSGNVTHLVIADVGGTAIKAITTCTSFAVVVAVDISVAQYDVWEIRDPS